MAGLNTLDLSGHSISELELHLKRVRDEVLTRRKRLAQEIAELATREGLSVEQVLINPRRNGRLTYQNPSNPKQIWKGSGRKPQWLEGLLTSGARLEDLAVSEPVSD